MTAIINDRVLRAVRDLDPEQQECVVLRFLHGLSLAETALIMGKKSGAIKALQFRAIRALARALPRSQLKTLDLARSGSPCRW